MKKLLLFIMIVGVINAHAQEKMLIVGTYTQKESEGIYVYAFNEDNGGLRKISVTEAKNPSYLAVAGNYVYTVNENNGEGAVSAYLFDKNAGTLKFINTQPSHGGAPCYITVDKTRKWAIIANYMGGNFCVYPINADGSLGEVVQNLKHTGKSININRQEAPHAHAAVFSPDQKHIAIVDLGIDKIILYPFDASQQKPVNENGMAINAKPGAGPRHIVFHPTRPFAYTIEELSGYVSAYRIKNGKLTLLQNINAHPADFKGDIGSAAIKISIDGKTLYASNRGTSNTIAIFAIEQSLGKLRSKGFIKTGGEGPRDITPDPSGKYLLSTNSKTNTVSVFKVEPATGSLKNGTQTNIPEPVCLVFAD